MVAVGTEVAVAATGVGTSTGTEVAVAGTDVDVGTGVAAGADVPIAGTSVAVSFPPLHSAITSTSKNADIVTVLRNWTRT